MAGPTDSLSDSSSKTSIATKSESGTKEIKKSKNWKPIVAGIIAVVFVIGLFTVLRFTKFKFKNKPDKKLKDVKAENLPQELNPDGSPKVKKE